MIKFNINKQFTLLDISVHFVSKADRDAFAHRFMLSRMLYSHNDQFDNLKDFNKHLAALYGTKLKTDTNLYENNYVITFNLTMVDVSYLTKADIFKSAIDLLVTTIFDRKQFNKRNFNQLLSEAISLVKMVDDDFFDYGIQQYNKLLFTNEIFQTPTFSTAEELANLTSESLYDYYQNYFLNEGFLVVVNGNLTTEQQEYITNAFDKYDNKELNFSRVNRSVRDDLIVLHEPSDTNRALIYLGYEMPVKIDSDNYYPALFMTLLLGGSPESVLFKRYREALSLSYDPQSYIDFDNGSLLVYASVANDYKMPLTTLKEMVEQVITQKFSLSEFKKIKRLALNYQQQEDDYQGRVNHMQTISQFYKKSFNTVEDIKKINKVTLKDVNNCLDLLKLKVEYVLYKGDDDEGIF